MHVRLQMPEGSSNEVEGQLFHVTLHAGHSLAEMLIDSAVSAPKERECGVRACSRSRAPGVATLVRSGSWWRVRGSRARVAWRWRSEVQQRERCAGGLVM